MEKYLAQKVIKKTVGKIKQQGKVLTKRGKYGKVNWNNYNYPPFLNLIHFDMHELEEPELKRVQFLRY